MPQRLTPEEGKLAELISKPPRAEARGGKYPTPPRPALFKPEPLPSTTEWEAAMALHELLRIAPNLAHQITGVTTMPPTALQHRVAKGQGLPPPEKWPTYDKNTGWVERLLGYQNPETKKIHINPGWPQMVQMDSPFDLLAHEASHSAGIKHPDQALDDPHDTLDVETAAQLARATGRIRGAPRESTKKPLSTKFPPRRIALDKAILPGENKR